MHAEGSVAGGGSVLSFDDVVASINGQADLRLVGVDGLPLAGKSTLAGRLATATGGACVYLDDFVKPQAEGRWRDRPSFPFDYIRYEEFLGAVVSLATRGCCRYRPYDFATGGIAEAERVVRPDRPVIVEGVSALHPTSPRSTPCGSGWRATSPRCSRHRSRAAWALGRVSGRSCSSPASRCTSGPT